MDIRAAYFMIMALLVIALIVCAMISFKSPKPIGKAVGYLNIGLIPPIIGNMIIILTGSETAAIVGYYFYFIGMNGVMINLVNFTDQYCKIKGDGKHKPTFMYMMLMADTVQILLNPVFGHTFGVEAIDVSGSPYYRLVPYIGQTIHRVVDYFVFTCVALIFILISVKTTRVYREKYTVVLLAMLAIALVQTFFIFSRTPIDRSMIGYGIFGIFVFYLALYYRPLRLLDRLLSNIASSMQEALFVFDPTGKCIWANEPGMKLTGINEMELDKVHDKLAALFGEREAGDNDWSENKVIGDDEESMQYYFLQKHTVRDNKKHLAGSFLSIHDRTDEQRRLKKEIYNTTHDSLTGLYTKQYLYECIKRRLNEDRATDYVVIYIDVKNFKIVNDVFGTKFGDLAIQQIAGRIRKDVTERSIFGRLAGDTFGVLMPAADFSAKAVEERLGTFTAGDGTVEHHLSVNAGVFKVSDPDMDVSVMFDRAHLSLQSIKDNYKSHVAVYDNDLREKVLEEQKLCADLEKGIKTMQIRPYLQPIVDRNGNAVGAEALVRWIHPVNGFMPPAMFIPLYEKNGMIVDVDRHMWRCACKKLAEWKGVHDDIFISVNISPKDFYYIDVAAEIKALVEEYAIEPKKLRLEITETVMMKGSEDRMKILDELREAGFIVEMDDFGSGYSSLNLLKDMPVDLIKIDMKFLSSSDDRGRSDTIIRHIINMSDDLYISTLIEGVETKEQFELLSGMGCKLFQGYYFAKPMAADDFEAFAFKDEKK